MIRYQVFVSSTYTDLVEERKEATQAILETHCFPAGMELFPAANQKQWDIIKKVIDECDYYLLIIGGRYGSQGKNDDGKIIGFTEMEFDYAVHVGKPIIAFIHDRPNEIPAKKAEKYQAGKKRLEKFKKKVQADRLVRYWNNKDNLKAAILSSLPELISAYPSGGWLKRTINNSEEDVNQEKNKSLLKYIIDTEKTYDLESSVGNYPKRSRAPSDDIYVQSSRFVLEGDDLFQKIIIWNFQKGATYHYLIPDDPSIQDEFFKTAIEWYERFSLPLESEEKFNSIVEEKNNQKSDARYKFFDFWSRSYNDFFNWVGAIWKVPSEQIKADALKTARKDSIDCFLKLLKVSVATPNYFYITTAMYEVKDNTGNNKEWKAIVKLPTEKLYEEYYAFKVYGDSAGTDKADFVKQFKTLCNEKAALEKGAVIEAELKKKLYDLYQIVETQDN